MYLSLNGETIPNHGYVAISDIGSNDPTALLCNTDRGQGGSGNSGGDWFAPDGTTVGNSVNNNVPGFVRNRDPMVVRLLRDTGIPAQGIYWMLREIIKLFMLDCTTLEMVVYGTCYYS